MFFDHFSIIAPLYNRIIPEHSIVIWEDQLALSQEMILLDAAGGTGRISTKLSVMVKNVVLTDLSLEMLHQVKIIPNQIVLCSANEQLPIIDGFFDRIIMVDAFHHTMDQIKTAMELWRVLKPGGRLLIIEPDIRTATVKLLAFFEKIALMRSNFYQAEHLAKLFIDQSAKVSIHRKYNNYCLVAERLVK